MNLKNDFDRNPANKVGPLKGNSFNSTIPGVNRMAAQLQYNGGLPQQQRMIRDKRRSLDKAVLYSYQGALVKKMIPCCEEVLERVGGDFFPRALINPNKLKQDYDDKIISIGYEHGFQPGDVFEWVGTNTYWLIYLQDLTELAYFRGDIRKCSYTICWEDEDGTSHMTYAAIRGPVETKIDFIQKYTTSIDEPNHSLDILMPKTDETIEQFKRYSKFYLQEDKHKICWRVEGVDWISMPGVLEVQAVEYYVNDTEDDQEAGLVGSLKAEPLIPHPGDEIEGGIISGDTFIKPKKTYEYVFSGKANAEWSTNADSQVNIIFDEKNPKKIQLKWNTMYSGQFELYYGKFTKTIVVESLF